ncbi:hypothetical protein [Mesorhizobium sp. CAU 1732]|uniref:hypothetical protein n=1 Tax=Mesorhizobium sp. CAU 1732 TaxID=3140358 RepID=UPI0032608088
MNAHTHIDTATASPIATKRIRWKFRIGDLVDHRSGGMVSLVVWRGRTMNGLQMYGLAAGADNKMRMFRGDFLVRV